MQNYFTLLGLDQRFDLNEADVHRAYVKMQQETHPDRMVGKSERERAVAIQLSMDVNEAYETLKSPLNRAQHLLALEGIIVNEENQDSVRPSQDLLMEVMELREQLEESQDPGSLQAMVKDVKKAADASRKRLADLFAADDYERAAQEAIRLRYLGRSLEEAHMRIYQLKASA